MKNKIFIIGVVTGLFLTIGIHMGQSIADEANISGKGNFIFKSGEKEVGFYAEDIAYLQGEITKLFNEMESEGNENE